MEQQLPLISRKLRGDSYEYQICAEGLFLLKTLKSKKLRIIFNITHKKSSLSQFNHWFLDKEGIDKSIPEACLTITRSFKQITEDRVIIILTAYQYWEDQPFMVLLGYLGASVFIYHHYNQEPGYKSNFTITLSRLWGLLQNTDINELNSELSFSKGYAKNPYLLCLVSKPQHQQLFEKVYRTSQQNQELQELNRAIDTIIQYFPMRNAHCLNLNKQSVAVIGHQFENSILGRTVFNFEFTGGTLQNLCYDCCEAFNQDKKINLNQVYKKIIENQKARLEGQSLEHFMCQLSNTFFFGSKFDMEGENVFPLASYDLLKKYKHITDEVVKGALQSATSCMTLNQFIALQKNLRETFNSKFSQIEEANSRKADNLCCQCFELLDNISFNEYNVQNLYSLFRQVQNKLQLYTSECQVITRGDLIQNLLWRYYNQLFQKYFSHLESFARDVVGDLVLQQQEQRVEIEDLKYRIKLKQNDLRALQLQYQIQGQLFSSTKTKLIHQQDNSTPQYTYENNKLRRKLQQLEQEVKDKTLYIEQLENILQRFEGTSKDKSKLKFSKEIQDLMKQVSQKVNTYYSVVRQAKEVNQIQEDLRRKLAKEKSIILEDNNSAKKQIARRDSEIEKLRNQMFQMEKSLVESQHCIEIMKKSINLSKDSINQLERNYAQVNCVLAETQHQLEYYRKGLLLIGDQSRGVKNDKLLKFCNTCSIEELKELLKPLVKR